MKLMDKRKKMFRRIRNRSILERIIILVVITTLILLVVSGYIDQVRAEALVKEQVIATSSSSSAEASAEVPMIPVKAPVVAPEVTKVPEVIKDTSCKEKVLKLAKGSVLMKYYDNVSKEVGGNCQKIRNVFALAFAESGLCKNQRAYNCWGIGPTKKFTSFENAISLLNENIGKYIGLSDSGLINNKSYCGSGCTNWSGNIKHALNTMK